MALGPSHSGKENESIEKQALGWNPQGAGRRGRPKESWKRTIQEKAGMCSNTWSEVKMLADDGITQKCVANVLCFQRRERV